MIFDNGLFLYYSLCGFDVFYLCSLSVFSHNAIVITICLAHVLFDAGFVGRKVKELLMNYTVLTSVVTSRTGNVTLMTNGIDIEVVS